MTPAARIMNKLGLKPDPWQLEVLEGDYQRLLLNCCRQAGKSTVVAILALVDALLRPNRNILILSPSHRQSRELYHTIIGYFDRLQSPLKRRKSAEGLELSNGSRIIPLPCREQTIRGYANVALLVIDEAARVYDDLYRAVRPMLAVSGGRLIALSTPHGKQGFFYDCWARGGDDWKRIEVNADAVPRIGPKHLEHERRALSESWFRQEYFCSFEALQGTVYPGLVACVVAPLLGGGDVPPGKLVGGID
ncbi:MAG TPA: terminase family protein, partial [Gemmataceae bacterium]|nr:terminase family protein [Gemmataceae bacterium]